MRYTTACLPVVFYLNIHPCSCSPCFFYYVSARMEAAEFSAGSTLLKNKLMSIVKPISLLVVVVVVVLLDYMTIL